MRLVDADEIIKRANEVLNKGVYKTMLIELVKNVPTQDVFTDEDFGLFHSNCNQYVCKYCLHNMHDSRKCEKCFALENGTMRMFTPIAKKAIP